MIVLLFAAVASIPVHRHNNIVVTAAGTVDRGGAAPAARLADCHAVAAGVLAGCAAPTRAHGQAPKAVNAQEHIEQEQKEHGQTAANNRMPLNSDVVTRDRIRFRAVTQTHNIILTPTDGVTLESLPTRSTVEPGADCHIHLQGVDP